MVEIFNGICVWTTCRCREFLKRDEWKEEMSANLEEEYAEKWTTST